MPSRIWGEAAEELVSNAMLRVEHETPGAMLALIADAEQRTLPQLRAATAIDLALLAAAAGGKGRSGGGARGRGKGKGRASGRGRGKGKGSSSGLRWYTRTGGNPQG